MQTAAATPAFQPLKTPHIGQYWPGQGGAYVGIVRQGGLQWHLIVAATHSIKTPWGAPEIELAGRFSKWDGLHNTQLILSAQPGNAAAQFATNLRIDNHADFYWPAQYELALIAINTPDHVMDSTYWSSTQYNHNHAYQMNIEYGKPWMDLKIAHALVKPVRRIPIPNQKTE